MEKLITALNILFGTVLFILFLMTISYLPDTYDRYSSEPEDFILMLVYSISGFLLTGTCLLNSTAASLPGSFSRTMRVCLLVANCIWVVGSIAVLVFEMFLGENQMADPLIAVILVPIAIFFLLNCLYQFKKIRLLK